MKKLNNKGLSVIELLVCFVIVAVIAISLLNVIMNYTADQQTEYIKNLIRTYSDQVTKVIEDDIISHTLSSVDVDRSEDNELKLTLHFKYDLVTGVKTKDLKIVAKENENYIEYPDIVKNGDSYTTQPVRYKLPSTTKIYTAKDEELTQNEVKNDIHFKNLPEEEEFIENDVFYLKIPIEHSELNSTYAITIVCPVTPE